MENKIKTFRLFIRPDEKSQNVAKIIREFNKNSIKPLKEVDDGDLVIAIGGDGTFIDAVTSTKFNKEKVYVGIHTGTLGFFQSLLPSEIYTLIKYFSYEKEINTRKIFVPSIVVNLNDGEKFEFNALNEVVIGGTDYSKITFSEYVNGDLFQKVSACAICIASTNGDTARSMNAGGAIDFSGHSQLIRTLELPIKNATCENFIGNTVICSDLEIALESSNRISIIIDGRPRNIDSNKIKSVQVSMNDNSNYINKFELEAYSKTKIIREKILGYTD